MFWGRIDKKLDILIVLGGVFDNEWQLLEWVPMSFLEKQVYMCTFWIIYIKVLYTMKNFPALEQLVWENLGKKKSMYLPIFFDYLWLPY